MSDAPDIERIRAAYARIKAAARTSAVANSRRASSAKAQSSMDIDDHVMRMHHMRWFAKYNADAEASEAEYIDALAELFMAIEGVTVPGGPSECK